MKIREIMRPGPYTIDHNETLGSAQRMMTRSRVRHLPVLGDGRLVGILSERDVLAARAAAGADDDWGALRVRAAMRMPVQTAGPDESLTEIAGRMADAKLGAMPVVERGKLLGLVTISDVLDAEVREAMRPAPANEATAADAMTPWPLTVLPDAPLGDAVALMTDHHVRHLPVVDATSTIVGMVSERDLRTAIGDPIHYLETHGRAQAQSRVQDVMSLPAASVQFDRPVVELARLFADGALGALAVTDKFGALIGIVSYVDVLRLLAG